MIFSVQVQPFEGQYSATLVGDPEARVTAPTRDEALAALKTALEQRIDQGELVTLEIGECGLSGLAGRFRDDPTLQDICGEAYGQRDAEPLG